MPGWMPRKIITGCNWCGRWKDGPLAGQDITPESVEAIFRPMTGHAPAGVFRPSLYNPDKLAYNHAGDEPYGGGMCKECAARQQAEIEARAARMREAARKIARPVTPADGGTGEGHDGSGEGGTGTEGEEAG